MRAALLAAAVFASCTRQDAEPPAHRQISKEDVAAAVGPIMKELGEGPTARWAGEYVAGDGLGVRGGIVLAPKAGYTETLSGCLGLYFLVRGQVREEGNELELVVDETGLSKDDLDYAKRAPHRLRFIEWGQRRYLIPVDQLQDFTKDVVEHQEPRKGRHGKWLLASTDIDLPVEGDPALPLPKLIRGSVTAIKPNARMNESRLTFDIGLNEGITDGTVLYLDVPSYGLAPRVVVEDAREHRSFALTRSPAPVGTKVATRVSF